MCTRITYIQSLAQSLAQRKCSKCPHVVPGLTNLDIPRNKKENKTLISSRNLKEGCISAFKANAFELKLRLGADRE